MREGQGVSMLGQGQQAGRWDQVVTWNIVLSMVIGRQAARCHGGADIPSLCAYPP